MRKIKPKNSFSSLNKLIQCYEFQNFGHRETNCRLRIERHELEINQTNQQPKVWKEKDNIKKYNVVLYAKDEGSHSHANSGCSRHMLGDITKFFSWKPIKKCNFTFQHNSSGKIHSKLIVKVAN